MWPDLGVAQWFLTAFAVFAGGVVSGASGFGFALVTAPVLLWVLDPVTMVTTNLGLSVLLRLPIVVHDRSHLNTHQTLWLMVGGLLGLPMGVALIGTLDSASAKIIINGFVILFGLPFLISPARIPVLRAPGRLPTGIVGMVSGALTTSSSLSGPPVVLWLTGQRLARHAFRVTTSFVGVCLNVFGMMLLMSLGKASAGSVFLPLGLLPAAALGGLVGHLVLQRITDTTFAKAAAALVVLAGGLGMTLGVGAVVS